MEQISLSSIITTIFLMLAVTIIILIVMKAAKGKLDIGVVLKKVVIDQLAVWITLLLLFLSVAEAIYTAHAHAEGIAVRGQIPEGARMLMHLSINLIAFVIQISLASIIISFIKEFRGVFSCFPLTKDAKKGYVLKPLRITVGRSLMYLALSIFAGFITFAAPAFNIYILCANMMELPQLGLLWSDIWTDMRQVYAQTPRTYLTLTYLTPSDVGMLGYNYSPYTDMSTAGKVLLAGASFHMMIALFEGLYVSVKTLGEVKDAQSSGSSSSSSTPPAPDPKNKPVLDGLILVFGNIFKDTNKVNDKAQKALTQINKKWKVGDKDHTSAIQMIATTKAAMAKWATMAQADRLKVLEEWNDFLNKKLGQGLSTKDLEDASKGF